MLSSALATPTESEVLVVTGTHTPVPEHEFGGAYTVITETQIKQRQAVLVSDLLRDVPGFAVSRSGPPGKQTQLRVRGAEANQVLVLIDGIKANDIAGGDEFDFAHLSTANIARIEIVRGPQSAFYGSDALSGVINIMTKKSTNPATVTGFAEAGSFDTFYGGGRIAGTGPQYHYNIGGAYYTTAGNNIARQGDEADGYKNGTLSFAAGVNLSSKLQLDVTGRHIDAETQFDGVGTAGLPVDADNETKVSQNYLQAKAGISLLNGTWENIVSATLTDTDNDNFISRRVSDSTEGKKQRVDYQANFRFNAINWADAAQVLTFGFEHERDTFTQSGLVTVFGNPNQKQKMRTTGLTAGYRTRLWQHLFLSGSARYETNSQFDNVTTYQASVAYKIPSWRTRFHASYGKGIKRPTFTERFGFYPDSFSGNPSLKPESSKAWDIGIEHWLRPEGVRFTLSYFQARLNDEITTRFGFPLSTSVNLASVSKRRGIELAVSAKLFTRLNWSATYTWLDATQPDLLGAQQQEIRRPRNSASTNFDYAFLHDRAQVNLNISYTGSQQDNFFPPPAFVLTPVDLSSYLLVNLVGQYRMTDNLSAFIRLDNLLNQDYEDVFGFRTPGFGAAMGINISFQPFAKK